MNEDMHWSVCMQEKKLCHVSMSDCLTGLLHMLCGITLIQLNTKDHAIIHNIHHLALLPTQLAHQINSKSQWKMPSQMMRQHVVMFWCFYQQLYS